MVRLLQALGVLCRDSAAFAGARAEIPPTEAMPASSDLYTALGIGGRFITVIPHLDMVVVSALENYGPANEELLLKLLRGHIFPVLSR